MMSCDVDVDSGTENEYNFEDLEKKDKPIRSRASSATRVGLGSALFGKPPIKVAAPYKHIYN